MDNASLLAPLLASGKITIDLAAHLRKIENGRVMVFFLNVSRRYRIDPW